ncbi:hypothetical protein BGZ92_000346 [Podila epicladia]|nr:hypothetical protein BGZ92_000346 [Podila epicladia]
MPFVETLESYSRALYLPLRAYVRRPFQYVTESIRDHVPMRSWDLRKALEDTLVGPPSASAPTSVPGSHLSSTLDALGLLGSDNLVGSGSISGPHLKLAHTPSMANFFTSHYFLLMFFVSIVMNRINAIVAPRNPHPLKLSVRFALKIPAFYLLMKSALVTGSLFLNQGQPTTSIFQASYTESSALWLSFVAVSVSCTVDSFISNLHNNGVSEQTTSVLEWAILLHFSPYGQDILLMSFVQMCQLLTLQFMSLSTRGRNYRLLVTTFFGIVDLSHFAYAIYYRSANYPAIQMLTRLPEVVVILMICISLVLHALTYLVTGGNVRRQMFDPTELPGVEEEYGSAIFKVGRACMEATRGIGFKNEIDAVVVPLGTVLDMKHGGYPSLTTTLFGGPLTQAQQQQLRRGNVTAQQLAILSLRQRTSSESEPPVGFSNEIADVVETPGQRQQMSRRRTRILVIHAFCRSTIRLLIETTLRFYNRVVPARFRRATPSSQGGMTIQDYLQLRSRIEVAMDNARQRLQTRLEEAESQLYMEALARVEEQEEEIYNEFLSKDFDSSDDETDDISYNDKYAESEYDSDQNSDELGDEDAFGSESSIAQFGIRHRNESEDEDDVNELEEESLEQKISPLRSLQDFFLDTSFMGIFLSSRLQSTPLTRLQYRHQQALEHGSSDDDINSDLPHVGRRKRSSRQSASEGSSGADTRTLMTVLKRYRRSASESGPVPSEPTVFATSPPPLIQPSAPSDDSTIQSRLLCVVCQAEPRGVLLRPCRCLALCNDCREVLASRRFKQCPCCRSEVQGFSKVFLP